MGAFARHQIAAAKLSVFLGLHIPGCDGDAIAVLLHGGDFEAAEHLGADLLGAGAQDGLQARLADEQAAAGTELLDALVQAGDEGGQFAAGQRFHADDGAVGQELLGRLLAHLALDPGGTEQFEGSHMEEGRPWHGRGLLQPLDDKGRDALASQEHGRGEADQSAP